ncbi:AGE family epimerase/isomerase [Muricauda sp. CAU 1633]|uniref:AGE family epimerase/isomerase n=1 Tax=Allomuricauda sp. CAU 1633 TaxID=2816036 RepID=UPI001A906FC2|nr:AGE family epimerase/isomerase [Muricauda sp. CAU 1633]MBO0322216.1 AGE family epimerase/isomerase [Muricauda sp. CAU 1633]
MSKDYKELKDELRSELDNILTYWSTFGIDDQYGGFVGQRDFHNQLVPKASKGIILNTRILWSFSAASNYLKSKKYESNCNRAYTYLKTYFKDKGHKGVFWEVDHNGNPLNTRKQVYAQAFAIYALSEYYLFSQKEEAKDWAISLFENLETYARDRHNLGYYEAFYEDWTPIPDMRLSDKDMNAAKTMNTHLHVLEAYTSLLKVYDHQKLSDALRELIVLFQFKFLNKSNHYDLFFDKEWSLLSTTISFGHDIETAWLVIEAAKALNDESLVQQTQETAIKVIDTFLLEALDPDGAVMNERDTVSNHLDTDRHWWPQVEALIGLKYGHSLTQNPDYIEKSIGIWEFTKQFLIDKAHGEWHFRVDSEGRPYKEEDKVSMWKAPYHTTRACILMCQ